MFLNLFRGLKQRVLWKWETGALPDKPPNVMVVFFKNIYLGVLSVVIIFLNNFQVSKWFPQQDLLGHPRVRLFIGHGGQSGFQEALCHQKPMVNYY